MKMKFGEGTVVPIVRCPAGVSGSDYEFQRRDEMESGCIDRVGLTRRSKELHQSCRRCLEFNPPENIGTHTRRMSLCSTSNNIAKQREEAGEMSGDEGADTAAERSSIRLKYHYE